MSIFADQSITNNTTVTGVPGEPGWDINQWLPWDVAAVYCAQFINDDDERLIGASLVPYRNWVLRNAHERGGYRVIKLLGKLPGVIPRPKSDGPVQLKFAGNGSRFTAIIGGSGILNVNREINRRGRVPRDIRTNAMVP